MPTFHNHSSKNSILNSLPVDEIEEGRRDIYEWGKKRTSGRRGIRGTFYRLKKLFIDKNVSIKVIDLQSASSNVDKSADHA